MLAINQTLQRLTLIFVLIGLPLAGVDAQEVANQLWYKQPAKQWIDGLPVGNGRLGAMVFGDPVNETIQLNEDSLWPGGPQWADQLRGTPEELKIIRQLLQDGEVKPAEKRLVDSFSNKSIKLSHQTMGELKIAFKGHQSFKNYKRTLSLDEAIARTEYDIQGAKVQQEVFATYADDALVIKLTSNHPEGLNCDITLSRPKDNGHETVAVQSMPHGLIMDGMITQYDASFNSEPIIIDYGVQFQGRLLAIPSTGACTSENGILTLANVGEVLLLYVAETSFYHDDYKQETVRQLAAVRSKTFDQLRQRHLQDYQALFHRVAFELGPDENKSLPTDVRIAAVKNGGADLGLQALLFQYGRYLLIGCSRPGANPANLQGLWNKDISAPWNADYHLNINMQMNYWPAEVTNLSACHEPLFEFIKRIAKNGEKVAKEQYGCRGFVAHHASDLWAPAWMRANTAYWGSWVGGGGWLVQHLWEHYQFTMDEEFLRKEAYPILKESALFYMDWLTEDPQTKQLSCMPSTSPENRYLDPKTGESLAVCMGSAIDHQIVSEVFENTLAAAKILGINDAFTKELTDKKSRLRSGTVIGPDGRLLEWDKPYQEPEKGHRHMSHLYAFHPGDAITKEQTPELYDAIKKSLEYRLANGGAGTGWSRAWLINFSARLKAGDMAYEHVEMMLKKSIAPNLFDLHPPFQIDGNFGYTAGIAEMLLQSHEGVIEFLPALPSAWPQGLVKGLKARGNVEVAIEWNKGSLTTLSLSPKYDQVVTLKYGNLKKTVNIKAGATYAFDSSLNLQDSSWAK